MENEEKKDLGLKEEQVEEVKKLVKSEVINEHSLNEKEGEIYTKILEEAQMPVTMKDEDFTLGANELDIRGLSKKNKEQMIFRQLTLCLVYLKQILTSSVDISRLIMVIAAKLGVEDIIKATDEVIEKVYEENEQLNKIKEQIKKDA